MLNSSGRGARLGPEERAAAGAEPAESEETVGEDRDANVRKTFSRVPSFVGADEMSDLRAVSCSLKFSFNPMKMCILMIIIVSC